MGIGMATSYFILEMLRVNNGRAARPFLVTTIIVEKRIACSVSQTSLI